MAFPEVIISVPRSTTAVAAAELLQNFPVADLTIEEVPIEDVMAQVFRGEGQNDLPNEKIPLRF